METFGIPHQMLPEVWEASKPGDLMREWKTRSVAMEKRVPLERRPAEVHGSRLSLPGLAPELRLGVRTLKRTQGIPINVVTRLWGRWTCPVQRPASGGAPVAIAAEGALSGAWVMNKHRSVRAYGERQRWSGVGLAPAPGSCPEFPWQSRARHKGGAARGSEGFRGVQETALGAVSCWRFKAFSRE